MTTCRSQKGQSSLLLLSMTANKVPSGSTDLKAGMAACFATTSSAYNGTLAQPQPPATGDHAMGATRRDPRGSEILGVRRPPQFSCTPRPGEVVSNTGKTKTYKGLDIRSNGGHPPCSRKVKVSATIPGDPYFCGINSF